VAATGPSLTEEVAKKCAGQNVIAVNDAYKLMPYADVLYACDKTWWHLHDGCPGYRGERWSSHSEGKGGHKPENNKLEISKLYGLNLVRGDDRDGFSMDPELIHYGSNSGFQAINLAILFGATKIILVGFDMSVNAGNHFFGDHPLPLQNPRNFERFIPRFERAAELLSSEIHIYNCTPGSALRCFKMMELDDALSN